MTGSLHSSIIIIYVNINLPSEAWWSSQPILYTKILWLWVMIIIWCCLVDCVLSLTLNPTSLSWLFCHLHCRFWHEQLKFCQNNTCSLFIVSKKASVKFLSFHSLEKEDLDFQRFYRVIIIIIIIIIFIITLWNFRQKKALHCLVN